MTAIRLLAVWAVVALALQTWSELAEPRGPGHPLAETGVILAEPPAAPIRALWAHWEAPRGATGWLVLEPDALPARLEDVGEVSASWSRQRVHIHAASPPRRAGRGG